MKIIHCADIHADSSIGTHFFSKEKAEIRKKIEDFENDQNNKIEFF